MLIKNLVLLKGFSSSRLPNEFPQKCWNKTVFTATSQYVDDLKQRLLSVWTEFKQSVIDKARDQ